MKISIPASGASSANPTNLDLSGAAQITDFSSLGDLPNLSSLNLSGVAQITNAPFLAHLHALPHMQAAPPTLAPARVSVISG